MIWLAIAITVVSSTSCSVGKALQKEATRHLPRFSASDRKVVSQYLHSRVWLMGLAADVGGAVLQIAAFAMAPVSAAAQLQRCWPRAPARLTPAGSTDRRLPSPAPPLLPHDSATARRCPSCSPSVAWD